ncbi:Transcription initiation factor TFIID subunit 5 [Tilletia horrida]|nr:Transcription initiation factor TFIID subunit 5 [Tilletia horrida]
MSSTVGGGGASGGAPTGSPLTSTGAAGFSESHLQAVLEYLQRRGFTQTEQALRAEVTGSGSGSSSNNNNTISIAELVSSAAPSSSRSRPAGEDDSLLLAQAEPSSEEEAIRLDPTDRARGFGMLKAWCEDSLDIYRAELCGILLPLFVHVYLDLISTSSAGIGAASAFFKAHASTFLPTYLPLLTSLRAISLPSHVATDPLAQRFRTERYIVKMTQAVFSLFLSWLTDNSTAAMAASNHPTASTAGVGAGTSADAGADGPLVRGRDAMLKIINERCRIQLLKKSRNDIDSASLEEGSGLTSAISSTLEPTARSQRSTFHPSLHVAAVSHNDAVSDYNSRSAGQLKLGTQLPRSAELEEEVRRELREEARRVRAAELVREHQHLILQRRKRQRISAGEGGEDAMQGLSMGTENLEGDEQFAQLAKREIALAAANADVRLDVGTSVGPSASSAASGAQGGGGSVLARSSNVLNPTEDDLLPRPATFRTVDIMREVSRIKDARRAITFGTSPSALSVTVNNANAGANAPNGASSGGTTTTATGRLLTATAGTDVPAQGYLTGVRDPIFNGLGEAGAQAARTAILPSICAYTLHDAEDGLTCAEFSEDGPTLMAAGFEESYVQIWNLKGEPLRGLRSDFALSQIKDRDSLRKFRQRSVTSTRKLIGHSGPVYGLSFDPISGSSAPPRHLLSSSADGTARLWSLDTFSALVSYRGHQHPVWDVQWSPLGIYFATVSADKTARLWSTERINPLRIYAGHLSDVDCLDFHPNTLYLATGSSDRTSRLWDVQRGACVRLFIGHTAPISTVKISPCGRYLATAASGHGSFAGSPPSSLLNGPAGTGSDTSISLWDLGSGRRIKKMWGHTAPVHSLDFSSDGAMLVSSAADWTVRCWDVRGAGGARKPASANAMGPTANGVTPGAGMADLPNGVNDPITAAAAAAAAGGAGAGGASGAGSLALAIANADNIGANTSFAHLNSSIDCLATFHTKRTPMAKIQFTKRNLCLAAGAVQL